MARLDHVVTGLITQIDSGIDTAKDSVLRKACFCFFLVLWGCMYACM